MKNALLVIFLAGILSACQKGKTEWMVSSPDGNVTITVLNQKGTDGEGKALSYYVTFQGKEVIQSSPLGLNREDQQFSEDLRFISEKEPLLIDQKYALKAGKQLECHDHAYEQVLTFKNEKGSQVQLILRAYNDGVAFCYRFPEKSDELHKIMDEKTGFQLATQGKAWIHPYDWNSRLKPSYEQYCKNEIPIGTDSPYKQGWAYPMLFNTNDSWVMITEAGMDGTYCATHIHSTKEGLYKVHFAEKEEVIIPDDPEPVSVLPWTTPWRVIIVGNELADIVSTTLVQNLNPPCAVADVSWIKPGRSSWSWWSNGGSVRDYKTQIAYVDFTAKMGWEYMLIDAGWQNMQGGTMEDVVRYANTKNVGVWLWYHSGAGMQKDTINLRNAMSVPEARRAEFKRIKELGVKGVKIDFFDTDKQAIVKLYKEILEDAAEHHILINFHGASLPRGLERTYPHLMTTEAIKGAEGFGRQDPCDRAAWHNTTVPFTRNVVGSMDYTPVTFSDKVRQGVPAKNKTTYAHQLALSVVFESGVQNFADKRESYESLPETPMNFMKNIPTAWDETKLIDGYPGDYVIMGRRKGNIWYIGGINGKEENRKLTVDLSFLPKGKTVRLITDGKERTMFAIDEAKTDTPLSIEVLPNGGFTAVIE